MGNAHPGSVSVTVRTSLLSFRLVGLCLFVAGSASAQSSEARIEQVGSHNVARVEQVGSAVYLTQAGDRNTAAVRQQGGDHLAHLDQSDGSSAEVLQTGAGHRLLGPGGAAAHQADASALVLAQHGAGQTAVLSQSHGAFAHITQHGAGNTVAAAQSL